MTHHDSTSRRGPTVDREPGPQEQLRRPGEDVSGGEPRVRVHRIALQDASTATGRIADGRPQEGRRHTLAPRRPGNPEARHRPHVGVAQRGVAPRGSGDRSSRTNSTRGATVTHPTGSPAGLRATRPGRRPDSTNDSEERPVAGPAVLTAGGEGAATTAATRCTSTASTPRWGRRTPAGLPSRRPRRRPRRTPGRCGTGQILPGQRQPR